MTTATLWFLLSLVLLAIGGGLVTRGVAVVGRHLRWPPFATGLVLIALATSVPELVVNFHAVTAGEPELALGNAVGSNVLNVGLTLAIAAIAAPLVVHWRALSSLLLVLLAATLLVILMSLDGRLSVLDGAILVVGFVVTIGWRIARGRDEAPEVRAEIEDFTRATDSIASAAVRIVLAAVALGAGAWLLVRHAPAMGQAMGFSPLLTGLLPVAIGTTLPEVAGAVTAARRGQGGLVAGHVIGSSLVNILLVLGGMALIGHGVAVPGSFVRYELPAAFAFGALMLPVLRGDMRVSRNEGVVLLVVLLAWLAFEALQLHR
jgi:cation:H+ antiporter